MFQKLLNDILANIIFSKINEVLRNSLCKKNMIDLIFFQSTFATREHSGIAFSNISVQVAPVRIKYILFQKIANYVLKLYQPHHTI